jgi:sugar/nucleoside kinase (ribokinase family)
VIEKEFFSMNALKVNFNNCRYKTMIGTGGIGSGMFFRLNGDHTLGREESRSGYFLDQKDYCKLHIISHYVQTLLGKDFQVIPVGKVGNDDVGKRLLNEMEEVGFVMDFVEKSLNDQTLFSFCFIYPDDSGGNMTTSDSACSNVDAAFVANAESEFIRFSGQGIALAAPEVPMEARIKLLDYGTKYNFFRVASFTSEEIGSAVKSDILRHVDLLGINLDEAAAAVGMSIHDHNSKSIIETAIETFTKINSKMLVSVTHGKDGSWTWNGSTLTHVPVFQVQVQNTAGAGDAHLAGLIVGLTIGLSLQEAQQLATLTGSSSVESPHTINNETDKKSLRILADRSRGAVNKNVYKFLED